MHLVVLERNEDVGVRLVAPPGFVTKAIYGARSRTKPALLAELAQAFEFPAYTGRNWDALEECLADLEWLPAEGYLLVVTDADQLLGESPEDYGTFLEVMETVAAEWAAGRTGEWPRPPAPFHVCLTVREGRESARTWGVPRLP